MPSFRQYLLIFLFLMLCSCATLDKSECLNADWAVIGMEDGARGRELSYVGEHRKACAKYNVSPDLSNYQKGYNQGLMQYCTYRKGYQLGQQGGNLKAVCPPGLAKKHQTGFQHGQNIYNLNRDIYRIESALEATMVHLEDLDAESLYNEDLIISAKTTEAERIFLLSRNKEIHLKFLDLEDRVFRLEGQLAARIERRNRLQKKYQGRLR